MTTVKITSPAQIPDVVAGMLGFEPDHSLVVLGTGGAPTARMDLGPAEDMAPGLRSAARYWSASPTVVVIYGDDCAEGMAWAKETMTDLGLTPTDYLFVNDGHVWSDKVGRSIMREGQTVPSILTARRISSSRKALEDRLRSEVSSAAEAEALALVAFEAGDGATAWILHDLAGELSGETSPAMRNLADRLTNAVDPSTI